MTLHFISDKELSRLEVLRDLTSGRLTAAAAAEVCTQIAMCHEYLKLASGLEAAGLLPDPQVPLAARARASTRAPAGARPTARSCCRR